MRSYMEMRSARVQEALHGILNLKLNSPYIIKDNRDETKSVVRTKNGYTVLSVWSIGFKSKPLYLRSAQHLINFLTSHFDFVMRYKVFKGNSRAS